MKRFDNIKRTRLKIVFTALIITSLLTAGAIIKGMNDVAVVGIGVIGAIVAKYNHDETNRPSNAG
jgi:hypothetical protein